MIVNIYKLNMVKSASKDHYSTIFGTCFPLPIPAGMAIMEQQMSLLKRTIVPDRCVFNCKAISWVSKNKCIYVRFFSSLFTELQGLRQSFANYLR